MKSYFCEQHSSETEIFFFFLLNYIEGRTDKWKRDKPQLTRRRTTHVNLSTGCKGTGVRGSHNSINDWDTHTLNYIHYFSVCLMIKVLTLLLYIYIFFIFYFFFYFLILFPAPRALPSAQYNKAFFFIHLRT